MTLLAGAVSVYSQGVVSMIDYDNGVILVQAFTAQSLLASTTLVTDNGYTGFEEMGNSANSYSANPGTKVYATGAPLGPGYDIGLLAAEGTITPGNYSALSPTSTVITTWLNSTGSASTTGNGNYGAWNTGLNATIPGNNTTVTIAIAAWKNSGSAGSATTLAEAQADGYAWGVGNMVTTTVATGIGTPGFLPSGLTDFSLVATPEPSTIALGVIGASALLFRRRK